MISNSTIFAEGRYESPSCELLNLAVDTAFLVDSIGGSSIEGYVEDTEVIDL